MKQMLYRIVTDGIDVFGTLEQGKPMPFNMHTIGPMVYSKEEAQAWVDEHLYWLERI